MIKEIENLPDVSFIDNITLEDVQRQLVQAYQERYKQLTGKTVTLQRADPVSLQLYACSIILFQALLFVDRAGKQDLLKYSYGEYLDNLAAYKGVTRNPAAPAEVTVRFTLSEARSGVVGIPEGTLVSNGDGVFFGTDEYTEIPAGDLYADITCTCTEAGAKGNGLLPGDINVLSDPLPYVESVISLDTSAGGSDIEDDESLADRIYLAPAAYSTAGPVDAYIQHTKSYSSAIGDVNVSSPSECEVEIRILLEDGSLPSAALLAGVEEFLSGDDIRPLTDHVSVLAPDTEAFNIQVEYFIARSDSTRVAGIQANVAKAVADYITWQTGVIGRDINPSELIEQIMAAGAKRCVVTYPVYTVIPNTSVSRVGSQTVTYGGIEDD